MVKILGLGHPRTGTGYLSKVLHQIGFDVGHEKMGRDGIVAWQFVLGKGPHQYLIPTNLEEPEYEILVYNIRNPLTSLASIVYTENAEDMKRKVCDFPDDTSPIERAIISIVTFDELICKRNPDIVWRIEDDPKELQEKLGVEGNFIFDTSKYNVRPHKNLETLERPREKYVNMINEFCLKYNYKKVF